MAQNDNNGSKLPLYNIDTIDSYNRLFGFETLHPLVSVVDFNEATQKVEHAKFKYSLYTMWLKHGHVCTMKYGRKNYDYQDGTIVSMAPGQVVEVDSTNAPVKHHVQGLLFHPDLIYGTTLGRHIGDYHFFDYDSAEALHLSAREQQMIIDTFNSIKFELQMPVDHHSQTLLVDRIKLVLDYCMRFYDRQFYTRHKQNSDVLADFEANINKYFKDGNGEKNGFPAVSYFADLACLSPGYFGDLIRKETGQSAQQYIQQKIVSLSKQLVLDDTLTMSQISDYLGFQYPQHFSRFFKRHVGVSPKEYRAS